MNTQQILKELNSRLVRHIHFHKKEGGWVYFAISSWQPFRWLQHGGWVCLNAKWLYRFVYEVPKQRGWRWG